MAQLGSALDWGSRGRRFKSCHPDGKQQVRGRFGQNPRRPLRCRVAIGVAKVHILSCPLLLRAAGRRRAPSVGTASRRCAVAHPPRACAQQIKCHSVCRPTPFTPQALAASYRPQCLLGLTAVPHPVVKPSPVSNQDRGRLQPLDCLAGLDPPKSATVAGERGTLRGESSVWAH